MSNLSALNTLLRPLVSDLGYVLLGLELDGHIKHATLRLYIDQPDYSGDIQVRDCASVSREVAALMDVEDPLPGQYNLEVSSPGVDRPLFDVEQFAAFIGEQASVKLVALIDGRRKLKGEIISAAGDQVTLCSEEQNIDLNMADIRSAKLVPDYDALLAHDSSNE